MAPVVVVFSDNWLPGGHTRNVVIELTPPGKPTRQSTFTTEEPGTFARDHADIRIGHSHFEGDLTHYSISVDAKDTNGLGCQLQLDRQTKMARCGGCVSRARSRGDRPQYASHRVSPTASCGLHLDKRITGDIKKSRLKVEHGKSERTSSSR